MLNLLHFKKHKLKHYFVPNRTREELEIAALLDEKIADELVAEVMQKIKRDRKEYGKHRII